jgi:hypothetical protein
LKQNTKVAHITVCYDRKITWAVVFGEELADSALFLSSKYKMSVMQQPKISLHPGNATTQKDPED